MVVCQPFRHEYNLMFFLIFLNSTFIKRLYYTVVSISDLIERNDIKLVDRFWINYLREKIK